MKKVVSFSVYQCAELGECLSLDATSYKTWLDLAENAYHFAEGCSSKDPVSVYQSFFRACNYYFAAAASFPKEDLRLKGKEAFRKALVYFEPPFEVIDSSYLFLGEKDSDLICTFGDYGFFQAGFSALQRKCSCLFVENSRDREIALAIDSALEFEEVSAQNIVLFFSEDFDGEIDPRARACIFDDVVHFRRAKNVTCPCLVLGEQKPKFYDELSSMKEFHQFLTLERLKKDQKIYSWLSSLAS